MQRFGQPYAVTHRADIHGVYLQACQGNNLVSLENNRKVDDFDDHGDAVAVRLEGGEEVRGRALIGCDGMWSQGARPHRRRRRAARVRPYRLSRRAQARGGAGRSVAAGRGAVGRAETHFVHYPLRRGELYNLVAVFHSDRYVEGWNAEGEPEELLWQHFKGQRPEVLRMLERIETWRMWVLCDREPVKDWSKGRVTLLGDAAHPMLQYLAQGACMASEDAVALAEKVAATPARPAGRVQGLRAAALSAHRPRADHGARLRRVLPRRAASPRSCATRCSAAARAEQAYDGMAWLYGGM